MKESIKHRLKHFPSWVPYVGMLIVFASGFLPVLFGVIDGYAAAFQRSGSIVVIVAIWSSSRAWLRTDGNPPSGIIIRQGQIGGGEPSPEMKKHNELADQEAKQQRIDDEVTYKHAAIIATIGTVVWGYGDLMARFFCLRMG